MLQPFSLKIERQAAEAIKNVIEDLLQVSYTEEEDKLLMAVLADFYYKLEVRLLKYQQEYRFTLAPHYALALRQLFLKFLQHMTDVYLQNKLHQISNQVHQQYN